MSLRFLRSSGFKDFRRSREDVQVLTADRGRRGRVSLRSTRPRGKGLQRTQEVEQVLFLSWQEIVEVGDDFAGL